MRPIFVLLAAAALAGCGGEDDEPQPVTRATATATPAPVETHPGLEVWRKQGCGSCHTFAAAGATGDIGPDLDTSEHTRDRGYVTASIVDPDAEVRAAEYGTGVMPTDYAKRISASELDALVEFITRNAGR